MSNAIQTALPWIVTIIAAAIAIPGIVDFILKKGRAEDDNSEKNTWMSEGIAVGLLAGYWAGQALGNAVLGLCLGILAGMFIGSSIKKYK